MAASVTTIAHADDGFQWATIGAAGNQAYQGSPGYRAHNRGSVGYEYKISKLEITTGQWLEFVNTFSTQTDQYQFSRWGAQLWGASLDTRYVGPGTKYKLRPSIPNAAMLPVTGISWRDAARYCNWLHNGKSSDLNALITGAYDTTTFGLNPDGSFTDSLTHLAGAKYWIPTFDEWMKAAYFDPDRYGKGVAGWWTFTNKSDGPGIAGLPGVGTTSAGLNLPDFAQWNIPLGAYPQSLSPWGLLDTSGGAREWTEEGAPTGAPRERIVLGSAAGAADSADFIASLTSREPDAFSISTGLRIATTVPSPGTTVVLGVLFLLPSSRRRT